MPVACETLNCVVQAIPSMKAENRQLRRVAPALWRTTCASRTPTPFTIVSIQSLISGTGRARKAATTRKAERVVATLRLADELGPDRLTTQAVADAVGLT